MQTLPFNLSAELCTVYDSVSVINALYNTSCKTILAIVLFCCS